MQVGDVYLGQVPRLGQRWVHTCLPALPSSALSVNLHGREAALSDPSLVLLYREK